MQMIICIIVKDIKSKNVAKQKSENSKSLNIPMNNKEYQELLTAYWQYMQTLLEEKDKPSQEKVKVESKQ